MLLANNQGIRYFINFKHPDFDRIHTYVQKFVRG